MYEMRLIAAIALAARRHQAELLRPFGISSQQLHLVRLARMRGSISLSAAARELSCDRPTMTVVARNCVYQGWLARTGSAKDARSSLLSLTGEGEELLDRIEGARGMAKPDRLDPLDCLSAEERAGFRAALEKVKARAEELYGVED